MGSGMYSPGSGGAAGVRKTPPLDNRLTQGGKPGELSDITSLAIYASDANAIRNNFYQLAKRIEVLEAALLAAGISV